MVGPPASPILVRPEPMAMPEPDPLPLKSHVILSCGLSTLLTHLCHEAQRVAVASVGTMVGTRHLISLTLFGYRTAALSLRSAASQQIIAHTLCLSVYAHITARRYWFQLRERRFSLPVPPRYLGHTQAMSQKSAQSDVTCCFVAARAHTRPHLIPTANSQGR